MALKQAALDLIAKITKTKAADLKAAIENTDEVDFAIDEKLSTFTEPELATLKKNEYNTGKTAGVEISVKEMKEELQLEFQGKTIKGLVEAAQKKAVDDAKIPANEKVTELQEKVTTLQATVTEQNTKLADKEKEVAGVKLNGELLKNVPAGLVGVEPDEVITLMQAKGYVFEMKGDKLVVNKDGKLVADQLSEAKPVGDVIKEFATERKWIGEKDDQGGPEGRGGGPGKKPVKFNKLSEIKAHAKANNIHEAGTAFSDLVKQAVADNKDFDMSA